MISLYKNGTVHTMDPACADAEAFVVEDGRFSYVGTLAGARDYLGKAGPAEEEVDLDGRLVLPAFNDSHMHLVHFAKSLRSVNLSGTKGIDEIRQRLQAAVSRRKPGDSSWLEGEGWNQDYFEGEKRFPNKFDLDDITGDIPVLIMRACFHIGVLNSAGMRAIGLNRETASKYGALAETLPDGEPNGIIRENLLDTTKGRISTLTPEILRKMLLDAQERALAQGLTCVQTDDIGYLPNFDYDMYFRLLREMTDSGELKLHIGEQCLLQTEDEIETFFSKGYRCGGGTEKFRINCVKLLADGSLGARTAALRSPYYDCSETKGLAAFTQEELNRLVSAAHRHECPVAIHAIGDRAVEMALDAIEYARGKYPDISVRDGIVHCQITDEKLLDRFRELDVLALVQPIFIDYDMNIVGSRVGPDLAATSYAWKSLMDRGVHVSFGTDCPVEAFNTMPNLYSAVSRRNITGGHPGEKIYLPEQRVSMEEGIRAYTMEGAYVENMEEVRGSITREKTADFVVLDQNLFNLSTEEEILNTHVVRTYVDGSLVYHA